MCDVLFVVPVFEERFLSECGGTLLLATIMKENGIDVNIYRYLESDSDNGFSEFVESSARNILAKSPRIVSFYCRGDCYLANIRVAQRIKEIKPDIPVVFGGPQADISAKETISRIPWVDYCCSGEGETTVVPLFRGLLNKEDVSDIRGLTFRDKEGKVASNPRPDLLSNLDELPFPDYSFLPEGLRNIPREKKKGVAVDVGRGCPFNCAYCSTSVFWKRRFRLKSPERIVAEVKRIEREFGLVKCMFDHDLFTANKAKVYEFCRILKESNFSGVWSCSSRADTIDKELIEEMISAGLESIYLGVETGSERMQKLTRKNLNLEKAFEIIKFLLEKKVRVTASFIYGFPGETEEDVEMTLQYAYRLFKLNLTTFQLHLCAIFPGTEYYNEYKDQLVFSEKISNIVGDFGVCENRDFIQENQELFPFYYEYRSELRDKFYGLENVAVMIMELHDRLCSLDGERFSDMRLVDLYLDFKKANKEAFDSAEDFDFKENEVELITNYLSTLYSEEEVKKLSQIIAFYHDLWVAEKKQADCSDVKMYSADIDAAVKGKSLSEIKDAPTMVYINKIGRKVTYVIKSLMPM